MTSMLVWDMVVGRRRRGGKGLTGLTEAGSFLLLTFVVEGGWAGGCGRGGCASEKGP